MAAMMGGADESADAKLWRERMGAKGWGAPTWPKPYGGGGLSRQRSARAGRGDGQHRRPQPDRRHGRLDVRPDPARVRHRGRRSASTSRRSPAASCAGARAIPSRAPAPTSPRLQTRCEDKGDHWLVNGQKIWTSGAQFADWCFCLVRTDPKAKKHEGISFLMIDMHSPGVEVRPILLINGTSPFCETFFTDVKVPKENQWGPLNGGWTVGKRLLQFERDSISAGLGGGNIGAAAAAMGVEGYAKQYIGLDETGRLADAGLPAPADRPPDGEPGLPAHRAARGRRGEVQPGPVGGQLDHEVRRRQDRPGAHRARSSRRWAQAGLGWEGDGFEREELASVRAWLRSKANSIEGGSSEINLNVVSKRVLGLPDPKTN